MFGLDARIALAIFGALSVISGAALYSAIESSRLEQARQRMIEMSKAVEAFYLDTGQTLSMYNTVAINIAELVEDPSINGWNGPYIQAEKLADTIIVDNGNPLFKWFLYKQTDSSLVGDNSSGGTACTDKSDCSYWLKSHIRTPADNKYPNVESYVLKLDNLIDDGDGEAAGKFRINWYGSDRTDPIIFYRVMPGLSI